MKTSTATPNSPAGAGSSPSPCSAGWKFRSKIEWTPLRDWHPAFRLSWWIGGQIGKYANDAYTIGFRVCGLFVGFWVYLPNAAGQATAKGKL